MPRRLPVRPAKLIGNLFVLFVLIVMSTIYYTYVVIVWSQRIINNYLVMALLVGFHLLFFMLLWSFFQSMTTDPGQVPVFWGFHLGDPENKRRRYCLMCNVFKPERCHHCSACNRCVLNMDHHCPWINNCIGFWNRKYFLLLLFYVFLTTYYIAISMFYDFAMSIKWEIDAFYFSKTEKDQQKLFKSLLIQLAYILTCLIGVLLTFFFKFHIYLASTNKTTIENLDKKGRPYKSLYDMGPFNNLQQILGTNKWLWPFPVFCGSGKPIGDGIYWQTNQAGGEEGVAMSSAKKRGEEGLTPQKSQDNSSQKQQQQTSSHQSYKTNLGGQFVGQFDQYNPQNAGFGSQGSQQPQNYSQNPNVITSYPQQQQFFGGQQQQQQVYGQPQNQIFMHGQDKDQVKKNLNAAIFQNNQRALQLNQQVMQSKEETKNNNRQSKVVNNGGAQNQTSGKVDAKKRKLGDPKIAGNKLKR